MVLEDYKKSLTARVEIEDEAGGEDIANVRYDFKFNSKTLT